MSENTNVIRGSLKLDNFTEGKVYPTLDAFIRAIANLYSVEMPTKITNVIVGSQEPGADYKDGVWIRRSSSGVFVGIYIFQSGAWTKVFPEALFQGDTTPLGVNSGLWAKTDSNGSFESLQAYTTSSGWVQLFPDPSPPDYAAIFAEYFNSSIWGGTSVNAGNDYFLTTVPVVSVLSVPTVISFIPNYTNTGSATINVNSLGETPVVDSAGNPLVGGEFQRDVIIEVTYDGTSFVVSIPAELNGTYITNNTVSTLKLADLSVTTTKLADLAVTTAKIAQLSVTDAKLASNSVTTNKIADLAVTSGKLANEVIAEAKIAAGAVTSDKIAALAVVESKLGVGAVTTTKLSDSSVTTAKLADNSVTLNKISDGSISTAKLGDNQVTENKLGLQSVSAAVLAPAAVTTDKINGLAVTTDKLAALSVTEAKIAASAVTTAKIAYQAVDRDNIADSAISAAKLGSTSVTTDKIQNAAVTTAKIANDAVTSDHIDTLTASLVSSNVFPFTLTQAIHNVAKTTTSSYTLSRQFTRFYGTPGGNFNVELASLPTGFGMIMNSTDRDMGVYNNGFRFTIPSGAGVIFCKPSSSELFGVWGYAV